MTSPPETIPDSLDWITVATDAAIRAVEERTASTVIAALAGRDWPDAAMHGFPASTVEHVHHHDISDSALNDLAEMGCVGSRQTLASAGLCADCDHLILNVLVRHENPAIIGMFALVGPGPNFERFGHIDEVSGAIFSADHPGRVTVGSTLHERNVTVGWLAFQTIAERLARTAAAHGFLAAQQHH